MFLSSDTPVEWLHRMVIAPKKDGSPRRTVDLQALNQASVRQTHHTASPYHTAASIPCVGAAASSLGSAVSCRVEGRAIDTALGQCFIPNSSH